MEERPDQSVLVLTKTPRQAVIPKEMIWAKKTAGSAVRLSMDVAMLEDKEVYLSMGIDASTWSRILNDKATLPADKISLFCEVVGNRIYVDWVAYQVGCTTSLIETEAERLYRLERDRADQAEAALALVIAGLKKT
jgi:hypothetical protein